MKNEIPQGTAAWRDNDELNAACLKAIGCLVVVVGALVGVGMGFGYLLWGCP